MVNRIATFTSTDRLITDNMRLQSALADTQTQLSTGLKSLTYKGIASETQRLLNVERSQDALKSYNTNGTVVSGNIDIMYNAVNSMIDLSNNFLTTLTASLGGNFLDPQVAKNQADILMKEMAGLLNTQSAGRYLFGGSAIDVQPVDLTDPAYVAQTSPSTADTSYYQGDNKILNVQMSETMVVNYGVTANNPAFEQALRAFNLVYNNPTDTTAIAEAADLMRGAIGDMANVLSAISTNSRTVDDQSLRNEEDISVMDNVVANIKKVDLAGTTVKQKELETQIQASYSSSVAILNLKLSDYL